MVCIEVSCGGVPGGTRAMAKTKIIKIRSRRAVDILLKLPADAYLIIVIERSRLTHRTLAGKLGLVLVYYSFDVYYV